MKSKDCELKVKAVSQKLIDHKQKQIEDAVAKETERLRNKRTGGEGGRALDDTSEEDEGDALTDQLLLITKEGDTRGRAANELWGVRNIRGQQASDET